MKKNYLWLGILAIALVFGMVAVGCETNDGPTDTDITYEGADVTGNTYSLTVTKKAGRAAAYTPVKGDSYVLTITTKGPPPEIKISSGTVESVSKDGTFELKPSAKPSGAEEAPTFSIVINKNKKEIKSVTGDIVAVAIDAPEGTDPEVFTPRSFGTIYLRAGRWENTTDNKGATGEQWTTNFFLADFYESSKLKSDTNYKVKISGTVEKVSENKKLEHVSINFQRIIDDGGWYWIGFAPVEDSEGNPIAISGPFEGTYDLQIHVQEQLINESGEIVVEFTEPLWYKNPDGTYLFDYVKGKKLRDDEINTIKATISNFNIELIEVTE